MVCTCSQPAAHADSMRRQTRRDFPGREGEEVSARKSEVLVLFLRQIRFQPVCGVRERVA